MFLRTGERNEDATHSQLVWRAMSNTQHTPRDKTQLQTQLRRCARAHTKRTSSESAHEVQPRPRCLAARQHTRCLCGIIPRFSCQSYASAKHASAHRLAPRLAPPPPLNPLCVCRSQRCLRRITAPWVGTQPTDTRLQHPWSDGQRFSRWSLRCCAVPSQPHSSPPPQHEQLEFPMRLSLAQTKPQ